MRFANFALLEPSLRLASHELRLEKPAPAIYRAFQTEAEVEPGALFFFDDSAHNIEGANACGWHAFQVDPTGDPASQMRRILIQEEVLSA